MIPTNRVIANRRRRQQQAATNHAFATAFAATEAAVAPPIPPATVPRLDGFAAPPAAAEAAAPPTAAALHRRNTVPPNIPPQRTSTQNITFAAAFPNKGAIAPAASSNGPAVPPPGGFVVPQEMDAAPIPRELAAPQAQPIPNPPPPRGSGRPQRAPRRQLTLREQYYPALINLMRWKDGRAYASDHQFTRDELLEIHADHVYRHFKDRVYGNPDADEGSTPPLHFRLHSVLAWKRNISYFMPNTHQQWNDARQEGNPTRSVQMSRLTKAMRRFQTQRRGVESSVRRPLTTSEFEQVMEAYWRADNKELGLCGAALTSFQLSMIGRLDDCSKFRLPEL